MQDTFSEKRLEPRSRVFFGGEILLDPELPAIECHVKSVSRAGASVVVQNGDFLRDRFELVIRKTNERHHVVVMWSCGRRLGLAFRPYSAHANSGVSI
jgi:PilZ domain